MPEDEAPAEQDGDEGYPHWNIERGDEIILRTEVFDPTFWLPEHSMHQMNK